MTKEEQQRAIAETRGWKEIEYYRATLAGGYSDYWRGVCPIGTPMMRELPDYLNDRNAMGDVMNGLSIDDLRLMRDELCTLLSCAWYDSARFMCAPCEKLAEAYLKSKKLWTKTEVV